MESLAEYIKSLNPYYDSHLTLSSKIDLQNNEIISSDPALIRKIVECIAGLGLIEPHTDQYSQIIPSADDYTNPRERLKARAISSRQRSVLYLLRKIADQRVTSNPLDSVIFLAEHLSPLRQEIRSTMKGSRLITSELTDKYTDSTIRSEDITRLTFKDELIDIYIALELFEHVDDINATLQEAYRVLRKGGTLIATFPFDALGEITCTLAVKNMESGDITFLQEPQYHDDPLNPDKGSLVYRLISWDILKSVESQGLAPQIEAICSWKHGICSTHHTHIFVLTATKP
jgi:SAM-dependent methyltransferase